MLKLPKFHLLSTNTKLRKSDNSGYLLLGLQLAPDNTSGFQVCPAAKSAGCRAACIFDSGVARYFPKVNAARIKRTKLFFEQRTVFFHLLMADIETALFFAEKQKLKLWIRLNVFSDIDWKKHFVYSDQSIFDYYGDYMRWYDYTKMLPHLEGKPDNYYLNFSHSPLVPDRTIEAISRYGCNPVVVYDIPKDAPLPPTFEIGPFKLPVIDGDVNDLRFLDPPNVAVGVREKRTNEKSLLSIKVQS